MPLRVRARRPGERRDDGARQQQQRNEERHPDPHCSPAIDRRRAELAALERVIAGQKGRPGLLPRDTDRRRA